MLNLNQGHICWNCGGPGIHHSGSTKICPKCEVTWKPIAQNVRQLNARIVYYGIVIDAVDFTRADAPSCP